MSHPRLSSPWVHACLPTWSRGDTLLQERGLTGDRGISQGTYLQHCLPWQAAMERRPTTVLEIIKPKGANNHLRSLAPPSKPSWTTTAIRISFHSDHLWNQQWEALTGTDSYSINYVHWTDNSGYLLPATCTAWWQRPSDTQTIFESSDFSLCTYANALVL